MVAPLIRAIDDSVRAAFCVAGSTLEGLTGLASVLAAGRDEVVEEEYDRARRFRRLYCDDPGPEPPPPPFIGGQCAVGYQANYTVRQIRKSTGEIVSSQSYSSLVFGPAGATPLGPAVTGITRRDFSGNVQWYVDFQNGRWYANLLGSRDRSTTTFDYVVINFSFRRVDGLPDSCGDPPIIFPPPSIPPVNVNVEISPGISVPFTFVFAPVQIDVNGSLTVPVNISGTADIDLNLNGKLVLAPNFEFQLDPGDFYPDGEPTEDPGGDGQGEGEPTEDPEDPAGRIYAVSVRCRIDPDSPVSGIYQGVGPDIYAPRLGSIRFGTSLEGVTFWTEDIDVKGLNQIVECPIPWGATRVVFNAAKGVIGSYSPIKTAPKDWPPYLELLPSITSDNR